MHITIFTCVFDKYVIQYEKKKRGTYTPEFEFLKNTIFFKKPKRISVFSFFYESLGLHLELNDLNIS
jgi:hypothetical protein